MSKVIVITSGKGGVGKTTVTANVGAALALRGHSVVLVDTDIGLRNLDVVLGLENRIVYDLVDVVEGLCTVQQALVFDARFENKMALLPAAQTRDKSAVAPDQMRVVAWELRELFDYVLIDCPAGIEQGFQNAIAGADIAAVVTNPELSALRDADRVIGLLASYDLTDARLIINRARYDLMQKGEEMTTEEMVDLLGVPLLGLVPDDEGNVRAANAGEPIVLSDAPAGRAFRNIASRIAGERVPFEELKPQEKPSFWQRLLGRFVK